ncbi:hypothetical protein A1O1_06765 [Capronia coronata CBS 617.96]|uniref:Transcription factor domain-containing protein n=1 Tax=Capronia coronata CBS 617.96 TaxID=1182541 RepID=W9Y1L6_9EURO|nr:uncharacterized protein A1O1_06765 [Capronia coronata CBS 617.96]EXJ83146.1 hypothetical protein A1O1_06765 [Capronia coronata CBS 617.96]
MPLSVSHAFLLSNARLIDTRFHIHYGRWVRFAEDTSTPALLVQVRRSPLLLCSIFLIAVRHTTQELADQLAPLLFEEARRLVSSALLDTPQPVEFFQAALVLSLWSTTIGQTPLSIDSWLLTGYALQQGLASSHFSGILHPEKEPNNTADLDAWCLWNHICIAHLQYCVGTRRQALLNQAQISRCVRLLENDKMTNFEARMAAEIKLYWIIYEKCCISPLDIAGTKNALRSWHQEWAALFDQPRAQFLEMGFHFAHLIASSQALKSARAVIRGSILTEMVNLSKAIINLAMETTDERTRHLTDHIYHIITFSALTLCRLVHAYESKLRAAGHDIAALDELVFRLVGWLRSIGLPCHAAHLLGDIVLAQFTKLRPAFRHVSTASYTTPRDMTGSHVNGLNLSNDQALPDDITYMYPEFIFDANTVADWPQWDMMLSDTDLPV